MPVLQTGAAPRLRGTGGRSRYADLKLFYWGIWGVLAGISLGVLSTAFLLCSWVLGQAARLLTLEVTFFLSAAAVVTISAAMIAVDLGIMLPRRRIAYRPEGENYPVTGITVALTAYNDEDSIGPSVRDFLAQPIVRRVIVVSNNSRDRTMEMATAAGALVFNELQPGYGRCVYRCLQEALAWGDTECIALCEGDMTFRARDLAKLLAYLPHAEIVNGTRIVEQLRAQSTQLSTFMYYGNFFVGKLLEVKHLGRGTFTDVGATYKLMRKQPLAALMPYLNPAVNLEFNAHFLDTALSWGFALVECPVSFHPRVGQSKGGNVNNFRALQVGMRMIRGLTFGWKAAEATRQNSPSLANASSGRRTV